MHIKIEPENQQALLNSLLQQLRESQEFLDNKTREVRDLNYEVEKARSEESTTLRALQLILKPLVEEQAALYLTHENHIVRRVSKEILAYNDRPETMSGTLSKSHSYTTKRGY
jgi:hypothetical protein